MALPKDVIYKSLSQVLRALSFKKDTPEVRNIMKLCVDTGLIQQKDPSISVDNNEDDQFEMKKLLPLKHPFIVIEGMDGTGKTTLTRFLSEQLQMKLMSTPPKNNQVFIQARDFFDDQPEPTRRAYYSLGNYLAAAELLSFGQPVVMDRFWHSTAAYALAHLKKSGGSFQESSLVWPTDLLQPDLVIFLQVSETERLRRHSTRKEFTNTAEEQTLADDQIFRQNLMKFYRQIIGPPMIELTVDGEQKESESKILQSILKIIPILGSRLTRKDCRSL